MKSKLSKELAMEDFYHFASRNYLTTFSVSPEIAIKAREDKDYDKSREIRNKLTLGDFEGLEFPVIFREDRDSGKRFRDVLDNRGGEMLISDRLKQLLFDNNITGWKSYPIRMYDKRGNEVYGYSGFSVTGRCGGTLEYRTDKVCYANGYRFFEGLSFDIAQWDGSDIFMVNGNRSIIITKLVYKLFKAHKIDAIDMCALPEYDHGHILISVIGKYDK
ncbi:MAG: hypothetical protein E7145_04240 [Rikenellaceae bacterium]|nr:hypothetical protein [Rikenellaceae bacterium]